ncbi:ribosomal protein L7/L12 [Streptomyces sp. NPDC012438]|uniref:ribosomal protein L7/L12 n=1 Tax=Streptomyces sp. NPDC012438 TaxID=3364833 RepID=UPI0036EE967E
MGAPHRNTPRPAPAHGAPACPGACCAPAGGTSVTGRELRASGTRAHALGPVPSIGTGVGAAGAERAGGRSGAPSGARSPPGRAERSRVLDCGQREMDVVRAVRQVTGLSLWYSRVLMRGAPVAVLEDWPRDLADEAVAVLRSAGAEAEARQEPEPGRRAAPPH